LQAEIARNSTPALDSHLVVEPCLCPGRAAALYCLPALQGQFMNQRDTHLPIPDVQSQTDARKLAIDRVGVKGLRHPLRVRCAGGTVMQTVAVFDMAVRLPDDRKGTHMSRFVELIEAQLEPLDARSMPDLLAAMLARLDAHEGSIAVRFPFFVEKKAPITGVKSTLDVDVELHGEARNDRAEVTTKVTVPVTSLCPCSKEISVYGAHNQRAHISIAVNGELPVAIESIIRVAEEQASSELYGVLKRADEKYVTERAYENPKFVEDVVRDVAAALQSDPNVRTFSVEVENFESIHNHSAFARIQGAK
jgi:GTP cyclohydrolase I